MSKSEKEKTYVTTNFPQYKTMEELDETILLKENEGSLYRLDLHKYYGKSDYTELCVTDSTMFVSNCNKKGGVYKIYNSTIACSPEASCIAKISNQITLESIADSLKSECEMHVANLPEEDPIPSVTCRGDSENGMVCDTIWN